MSFTTMLRVQVQNINSTYYKGERRIRKKFYQDSIVLFIKLYYVCYKLRYNTVKKIIKCTDGSS